MGLLILGVNTAFCFVMTLAMVGKGLSLVLVLPGPLVCMTNGQKFKCFKLLFSDVDVYFHVCDWGGWEPGTKYIID